MNWLYTFALWVLSRSLGILIAIQDWFDHQNGYDQTPPDWKGPI
jgi:hypothetical protein